VVYFSTGRWYTFQLIYTKSALNYIEVICLALSFFYQIKIDYFYARIYLSEKTITIKKILSTQCMEPGVGLWHLKNYWQQEKFLAELNYDVLFEKYSVLLKIINKYIQSQQVEDSSGFLILFNIMEIIMNRNQKIEVEFTHLGSKKERQRKYKKALNILLETIPETEYSEFSNRWKGIISQLKYKPMKSPLNKFLINNNLNPDKFPVTLDKILEIRNNLTHGSIKSVHPDELTKTTNLLYRISGILILNLMSIHEWELDTVIND
jgi:hypothetical protein